VIPLLEKKTGFFRDAEPRVILFPDRSDMLRLTSAL
jgi:hypothetical protein